MGDFRIVPKRPPLPEKSRTQYGFWIPDHPLGDPDLGFLAVWDTYEEAFVATCCLGYHISKIQPVYYFSVPEQQP